MTHATVLAAAAGACAAGALVALAVQAAERRGVPRTAPDGPAAGAGATRTPARRRRVDALTGLLLRLGRRLGAPAAPAELAGRLAAAGTPLGLSVPDLMAIKCGAGLVGAVLAAPLAPSLPGRLWIAGVLVAPAALYLAPDILLGRRARARAAAMGREVADVLDLLRVAVEAGLPVSRALEEVGRRRGGLLGAELRRAAGELAFGVPREEALRRLVARCPLPAMGALAGAVGRADRHGAPLGPALLALAAEARADQARAIRDAGARAAPKIQLVVALVLVPAVMLLVAAALVQTMG